MTEPVKTMSDATRNSYSHPKWQKFRNEVLERDNYTCVLCGSGVDDGVLLEAHHTFYREEFDPKFKPWEVDKRWVTTLCHPCHKLNDTSTLHTQYCRVTVELRKIGFTASDFQMFADYIVESFGDRTKRIGLSELTEHLAAKNDLPCEHCGKYPYLTEPF